MRTTPAERLRNEVTQYGLPEDPLALDILALCDENESLRIALHQILDETTDRIAFARAKGALGLVNPK